MKKALAILLAMTLLLSLCACGNSASESNADANKTTGNTGGTTGTNSTGNSNTTQSTSTTSPNVTTTQPDSQECSHDYDGNICSICGNVKLSEGLEYLSNGDGTCVVTGIGSCTDSNLFIPSVSPSGDKVTSIGPNAFYYVSNLKSVTLQDGIQYIEISAFCACPNLTSVTIPNSVTYIGKSAFFACQKLSTVTIGYNTGYIVDSAFRGCNSLTEVNYAGTQESWENIYVGENNDMLACATVHCTGTANTPVRQPGPTPSEGLEFIIDKNSGLCSVSGIGTCTDSDIVIPFISPEGYRVVGIANFAFFGCNQLSSVTLPESTTFIGESAFSDCTNLTSILLPTRISSINADAFRSCKQLSTINYNGTIAQWNAISFGKDWHEFSPITEIICSDGTIEL